MVKIHLIRETTMQRLIRKTEEWIEYNEDVDVVSVSHDKESNTSYTAFVTYKQIKKEKKILPRKIKIGEENIEDDSENEEVNLILDRLLELLR